MRAGCRWEYDAKSGGFIRYDAWFEVPFGFSRALDDCDDLRFVCEADAELGGERDLPDLLAPDDMCRGIPLYVSEDGEGE